MTMMNTTTKEKFVFVPHEGCEDCLIEAQKYKADWEVMMSVINPKSTRPRRTSLHTLAYVLGRKDPLALAEEMRKSGKVVGYVCPDVKTPIFYLEKLCKLPGMIDTREAGIWDKLPAFFEKNPYPTVKGFRRFKGGTWSGGEYGKGKFTPAQTAMDVPYEEEDYEYARLIIKTLKEAGFTPGIDDPANIPKQE